MVCFTEHSILDAFSLLFSKDLAPFQIMKKQTCSFLILGNARGPHASLRAKTTHHLTGSGCCPPCKPDARSPRNCPSCFDRRTIAASRRVFSKDRLVDDAHGVRRGVLDRHDFHQPVAEATFLPPQETQKLLQGSHRHLRLFGDGLHALAMQRRKLSFDVHRHVSSCASAIETIVKTFHKTDQLRFQATNLMSVHVMTSFNKDANSFAILSKSHNVKLAL
jgi:hypothetical protein